MITKELINAEVDKIQNQHLEALYRIIRAFETSFETEVVASNDPADVISANEALDWHEFIEETYGCLKDDPIERGEQGTFEIRESIL